MDKRESEVKEKAQELIRNGVINESIAQDLLEAIRNLERIYGNSLRLSRPGPEEANNWTETEIQLFTDHQSFFNLVLRAWMQGKITDKEFAALSEFHRKINVEAQLATEPTFYRKRESKPHQHIAVWQIAKRWLGLD
jgi:hypothetical protein